MGQGPEEFVPDLCSGSEIEPFAVILDLSARLGCGDEVGITRDGGIGPAGILPGQLMEHIEHGGVVDREQGLECGLGVGCGEQVVDGLPGSGEGQQGVIARFLGCTLQMLRNPCITGIGLLCGKRVFQRRLIVGHLFSDALSSSAQSRSKSRIVQIPASASIAALRTSPLSESRRSKTFSAAAEIRRAAISFSART